MRAGDSEPQVVSELPGGRPRPGCAVGCLGAVILIVLFMAFVRPYTDYLWFAHDAQHPEVFTIAYGAKGTLFALAFIVAVAMFAFNLGRALNVGMVYLRTPSSFGEIVVVRAISWIQRSAPGAVKLAAVVLGLLFAIGFSGEWNTYLLWRSGGEFGMKDPLYGLDVGFFVFKLPFQIAVSQFLATLFLITSLAALGIYAGMQALARIAKIELSRPAVRTHLGLLFGITLILYGVLIWFKCYEYGILDGTQFTGAGYAGVQKLVVQRVLAGALFITGIWTMFNSRVGSPYSAPIAGLFVCALIWLGGMVIYPVTVARFKVEPNKLTVEGPYAANAIKMTRWAYGLDKIDIVHAEVEQRPSTEQVRASAQTLESMRLWDPEILRRTIEVLQGLRPYYTFRDVDVDRYVLNGKSTPVMLSPRDVRLEGLNPNARTWVNTRLQYTHGYGVAMMAVNGADPDGRPIFLIKDFPPKTPQEIPLIQPRLYFSDFRDDFLEIDDPYALVGTEVAEFDYPIGDKEQTYKWTGNRGVPLSGFLSKLAFSLVLGDGNLLVSPNIKDKTRVLYRRNVLERARMVYPFLRFDSDPYIVIDQGRIFWIIDAFTMSDMVPYSDRIQASDGPAVNYIRNSVKVTVDAYSGEMNAYVVDPNEPILKAYQKIYPNLLQNVSEMPKSLVAHWRYPEDLFKLQSYQLTQYHVTDSTIFLNNSDAWELPVERGHSGVPSPLNPYYVQMQVPGESQMSFVLILPFTPRAKPNMSGWLAAHCDPDRYGKSVLFKFPTNTNMPGPAQMEANFSQDPEIANINKLWNTDQSDLISGNLLVVPIGKSVLYVKPLFLQSKTNPIPEMRKVVVALSGGRPIVADNYSDALRRLLGQVAPVGEPMQVTPGTAQRPTPTNQQDLKDRLREVARLFDEADAALRAGDYARYGQLQNQARQKLRELAQ